MRSEATVSKAQKVNDSLPPLAEIQSPTQPSVLGKSNNLVTFRSFVFASASERETKAQKRYLKTMKTFFLITLSVALGIGSVRSQTLLTETTWGGVGSDVAESVA